MRRQGHSTEEHVTLGDTDQHLQAHQSVTYEGQGAGCPSAGNEAPCVSLDQKEGQREERRQANSPDQVKIYDSPGQAPLYVAAPLCSHH